MRSSFLGLTGSPGDVGVPLSSAFQYDSYQDLPFPAEVRTRTHVDKHMKDKSNSDSWQGEVRILTLFGRSFLFSFPSFSLKIVISRRLPPSQRKADCWCCLRGRWGLLGQYHPERPEGDVGTIACLYRAPPARRVWDRVI